MNAIRSTIPVLATTAILALPTSAVAEEIVPPGNSAATQYTEAIPTAGGPKQLGRSRHQHERSPSRVLGARNAHKLDSKGPAGKATAQIAAETAPVAPRAISATQQGALTRSGGGPPQGGDSGETQSKRAQPTQAQATLSPAHRDGKQASLPSGSSGVGAVLAKATGLSPTSGIGLLLPLALLVTLTWAAAYVLRQHKRPAS